MHPHDRPLITNQISSQSKRSKSMTQLDLCKICLLPEKSLNISQEKKIYTIINTGNHRKYCRCNSFAHAECLVNWCIMKYTLQCPDCNIFFNCFPWE